jgi:hypothetical protein
VAAHKGATRGGERDDRAERPAAPPLGLRDVSRFVVGHKVLLERGLCTVHERWMWARLACARIGRKL